MAALVGFGVGVAALRRTSEGDRGERRLIRAGWVFCGIALILGVFQAATDVSCWMTGCNLPD